jgi:hypothetical protein
MRDHQPNGFNVVQWIGFFFMAMLLLSFALPAHADDAKPPACPTPGEKCKVVFLNEQEERILTGQNGILDTAAQGRSIDLGGFAVYFKSKITQSPQGTVTPVSPSVQGPSDPTLKDSKPN